MGQGSLVFYLPGLNFKSLYFSSSVTILKSNAHNVFSIDKVYFLNDN